MAKRLLKNEAEVTKYMFGSLAAPMVEALNYTMKKILERNQELILRIVYDNYDPEEYQRTMQFLDSWNYEMHTFRRNQFPMVTATFEQNPEKMTVNNELAQHGSPAIYGESWWQDAREYLADIIYNGKAGPLFGRGKWTRKRDVWKPLMKTVESKIYKWYADGLKQQGIVLK